MILDSPEKLVKRWLNNLCIGKVDPIVDFYHQDAILVPTLSKEIRQGEMEIRDYFIDFVGDHPNLCGEIVFEVCQQIPLCLNTAVVVSGVYTFTWDEDIISQNLTARFTFVFIYEYNGGWRILTHHSSAMPEPENLC